MEIEFETDLLIACVDFIGARLGAKTVQVRYSDDEEPVVWFVVAEFDNNLTQGIETAAALDPNVAAARLCEQLVDGNECLHCKRPCGFSQEVVEQPLNELICWYQYDPELKKIRRGCE